MPTKVAASKRHDRIDAAITRLAALFEYGELLASTEPDKLLNMASDEIERRRAAELGTAAERPAGREAVWKAINALIDAKLLLDPPDLVTRARAAVDAALDALGGDERLAKVVALVDMWSDPPPTDDRTANIIDELRAILRYAAEHCKAEAVEENE